MQSEFSTLIHNLVLDNPMPAKDLAKALGKPYSTLLREVNPYDTGAKLGAESLFQIMSITGNYKPMEYMATHLGLHLDIPNHVASGIPHITPGGFHARPEGQMGNACPTCGKVHEVTEQQAAELV